MIIGRFAESPVSGVLIGHIRTLFFKSDKVVFEPVAPKSARAPSHRIYTGDEVELGAAWRKTSMDDSVIRYEVTLDDPTFAGAVYARLEQDGPDRKGQNRWFILIWNRAAKKKTAV
ncbi:MAG: DUF736 domain-containing protein [Hyphomonadaceae bacterium]